MPEGEIAALQSKAAACAAGIGIGVSPVLLLILFVAIFGRRGQPGELEGRRGNAVALTVVALACLILPLGAAVGAVALYRAFASGAGPRVAPWREAGEAKRKARAEGEAAPSPEDEEPTEEPKEVVLSPVSLESIQAGDIKFARLDGEGMATSTTYFFRELLPEGAAVFTVNRTDENSGVVLAFRLRDVGTGEAYLFRGVPVKKVDDSWVITDEGWLAIKNELQAQKHAPLTKPFLR